METLELADGGILLYDEAFLPPELADRYFVELTDHSEWEQKPAAFGHLQPRLTASYGDEGITYRYSGIENKALPWTSKGHFLPKKMASECLEYHQRLQ